MNGLIPAGILIIAAGAVIYYWRWAAIKDQIKDRLGENIAPAGTEVYTERPFAGRFYWIPWIVGFALVAILVFFFLWPVNISIGLSISIALLGMEVEAWIYEWRLSRIEAQLADTIDVIVASLSSGTSLQNAMSEAADFSPQPLRKELSDVVARLKLGEPAQDVFESLAQKVPTETFQLLSTTLIVNWEMGGGLADTLAGLGKTIRDRIAISRQVRNLSTQGRLTTVTVIGVVWFMAAMMWQADPPRFVGFVNSLVGSWLITIALALQGVGIALVSKISRPQI